jgi:UDP-N-acetylmuramoyl-tripeptide--D-alanyl-D-alanine ligase
MKKTLKAMVVAVLGRQVKRLQNKNNFKTVGVVGSYGKTSTKMAIAEMLETELHVRYQRGNYNETVSVPLIFFGHKIPSLFNPFAWLIIFFKNELALRHMYPCDVVVVELGVDAPKDMEKFSKYLKLDYAFVTAIGPEHMEKFKDLQQVAEEELKVQDFSKEIIINKDLCHDDLLKTLKKPYRKYSLDYVNKLPLETWQIRIDEESPIRIKHQVLSRARLYTISSAVVAGKLFNISKDKIFKKIENLPAVPGRMNVLKGKNGSIIIDDTYNASPEATILALETLYSYPAKQRIALLGNMNELGDYSEKMHRDIGRACEPGKLDAVVTLGPEANEFLADQAEKAGCKVIRTKTPYEAAEKIEEIIKADSVLLAKGSQNGVFAEEAVKMLLQNPADSKFLVRQNRTWLEKKQKAFGNAWLDRS